MSIFLAQNKALVQPEFGSKLYVQGSGPKFRFGKPKKPKMMDIHVYFLGFKTQ